ncbi:cyclin-dependent kinase G-2 isoform X2 [Abrus precatorius]|uniref:cyclin-dependent kinase n=1 Tax=Abrus precatorius TaxID=3816 RepID=A0A8B8JUY4_ABRPR|nr:cyclin-dependent kinase G-2 isoform X2 [Abrus precatorius]
MAAGRKSVSLRRESYKYGSTKGFDDRSGSFGVEEREQGEICVEHVSGLPPPEKKRKFSPIIWDLAEEGVRISSESKLSKVAVISPPRPSPSSNPGANDAFYGDVMEVCSPNSSHMLPQKYFQNNNQDVEGENEVQMWTITKSRWACDDGLSPIGADDKHQHGKGSSSPETGEFQRECSESTVTRSDVEEQSDVSDSPADSENGGLIHVQRNINMLQSCRSVCEFEMIKKINEGTYGVVYKARDKKTGEIVALKKVKMNIDRDGFPLSSLREINILLSFNHPSIVNVKEVVVDDFDGTFMVMEYMEYDLKGLKEVKKQPFSMSEIKSLIQQLLEGVRYLHDNWVIHRDLKTSNILVNNEGELKICDFGLSRQYGSPLKPYTPVVVTLWYRAPELLLGAKEYSTAIDMWSVGCIMAELIGKEPLFKGKSELEQLDKIFRTLGTPNEKIWPGLSNLPGAKANFVKQPYNMLRKKFPATSFTGSTVLSELGFDLLKKLLTYDPEKRISAEDALLHDWFHEVPLPKSDFRPIFPSWRC